MTIYHTARHLAPHKAGLWLHNWRNDRAMVMEVAR